MDGAGNVYIADAAYGEIQEWMPSNNAVTTLVAAWLPPRVAIEYPECLRLDGAGNIIFQTSTAEHLRPREVSMNGR